MAFKELPQIPAPTTLTSAQQIILLQTLIQEIRTEIDQPPEEEEEVVEIISAGLAVQLDEVSDTVSYVGKADPGTLTASALWQIQRLTTTGPDLVVEWAGGNSNFDKIWDDHLSLSYS